MKLATTLAMTVLLALPLLANPLTDAAERGDLPEVRALVEQDRRMAIANYRVGSTDEEGETALHEAAENGHIEVCDYLIGRGAPLNARDDDGETPLHEAAGDGRLEVVKLLLASGAQLDPQDREGLTPLAQAARNGKLEVVVFLVTHTARVDLADKQGRTPLGWAVAGSHAEVADYLRRAGSPKP